MSIIQAQVPGPTLSFSFNISRLKSHCPPPPLNMGSHMFGGATVHSIPNGVNLVKIVCENCTADVGGGDNDFLIEKY